MRVVCSPVLARTDVELLRRGYVERTKILARFDRSLLNFGRRRLEDSVLWLVAAGKLEVRLAILRLSDHNIYHEKIGIFEDSDQNQVAFSGSANETLSGLQTNFEVVDVFRSWDQTELKRVRRKTADFEGLWSSETDRVDVLPFPQAAVQGLIRQSEMEDPDGGSTHGPAESIPASHFRGLEETLSIPGDLILFEHQQRAVKEWLRADGHGVFEMATGSGKTIAALVSAAALYSIKGGPLFLLIVCPYLHLVSQWIEVSKRFGLAPLPCAIGQSKWREELGIALYNLSVGTRPLASAVVTNATFISDSFQQLISNLSVPALIIGDEVHNLGALNVRKLLPENFQFRLGLSATPERWFDDEGSEAIHQYFGASVVKYTIEDALRDGVLCHYRYYPVVVELTESEVSEYYELTTRIAREAASAEQLESSSRSDLLEALLIKRARLIAIAQNKLPRLRDIMQSRKQSQHNLIYCGDGTVERAPDVGVTKQMDLVTRMLGHDLNMKVARYIADTPLLRREQLRRDFANGDVQCLVAIRCLDEGVDIPETRCALILASSTNPRQFIQRRGRVLRRSPNKDVAELFDFIVSPPADLADDANFKVNRQLVRKELLRIVIFANTATNGPEALGTLLPLRKKFNLLDVY